MEYSELDQSDMMDRFRASVADTMIMMFDMSRDDMSFVVGMLPPRVRPFITDEFAAQFADVFRTLAARIQSGEEPLLRCVADEIALYLAIEQTRDDIVDSSFECDAAEAVEAAEEAMLWLRDTDFLLLWSPAVDGFEHDAEFAAAMGMRPMHHSRWFEPYSVEP